MYSNCLFEAIKAKIKEPTSVKILLIPPALNQGRIHFMWKKDNKIYHYTNDARGKNSIWFDGQLRSYDIRVFVGTILCRLRGTGWSVEKSYKVTKKLGLSLTPADIQEDFERDLEENQL